MILFKKKNYFMCYTLTRRILRGNAKDFYMCAKEHAVT